MLHVTNHALICSLSLHQYNLTLVVSDSLLENSTTVRVRVKDVNDLPPKFSQNVYSVTIDEEIKERHNILQVILCFMTISNASRQSPY